MTWKRLWAFSIYNLRQGAFGHSCSADCACQKSAGLICLKGTCKCNATAA